MEKVGRNYQNALLVAVCALLIALSAVAYAQSAAEKALLSKAQSLAANGHLDMAVQTWQQALLADGNNQEALSGIARAYMQLGKTEEAKKYLDRLRAAGGSTAEIAKIQAMPHVEPPSVRISQAEQLAQQGRFAEAMRIYRDVFGENPPAGNYALAYYDTEAAIPADRPHAIAGLRRLAKQFPADSGYALTLGRVLTYDPKTRAEGMAILRQYESVPAAQSALKQAEAWNAKPPAALTDQTGAAKQPSPRPVSSPEASAFRALNAGRLDEAKQQFQLLLDKQPRNPGALSGMGYVYMKKQDFASAADYFERARAAGARGLDDSLNTARFWLKMAEAGEELAAGNAQPAAAGYRGALSLKPTSAEALEGLGGALAQAGEYIEAADAFERAVHVDPPSASAWRGLFLAQSSAGNVQAALDVNDRMPKVVRTHLATDPEYLRTLAQDNLTVGRKAEADRVIAQALALPFPNEGRDLPVEKQLQYAALLMMAKKYGPAIRLYQQVVAQEPENAGAWRALIAAQHQLTENDEALATVARMPQTLLDKEQNDPSFLLLLGSVYQSRHELDRAQKYLERAISIDPALPGAALQLADIYTAQGNAQRAYPIYRRELERSPEDLQAWRGVLNTLHQLNRDREGLRQIASMPESVRLRLEQDPAYLQTLASIQMSIGQPQAALRTFSELSRIYAEQNLDEPVDVQIQHGWALLKAGDDQKLYALVSNLYNAPDITKDQQADFDRLLVSWSTQQANVALAAGDQRRALAILAAAAQAFPGNLDVYNALAGVYLKAGQPKQAVAIYAALDMSNATLLQYQAAIGSALAAGDMNRAQEWIEIALNRYKGEPAILKLAAQYEQARGNNGSAAAYLQAALNAMGPAPIGGAPLSQPTAPSSGPSPTQQLMQLLAPHGRTARMNEPDSTDIDKRVDVSWQGAPTSDVPTLGDYAQVEREPVDSAWNRSVQRRASTLADYAQPDQQDQTDQGPSIADTHRGSQIVRARATVWPDDSQTAPTEQRSSTLFLEPPSVPRERDSVSSPVESMWPASARTPASQPSPQTQSQYGTFHREDSYVNDLNPAGRLQSAVREMNGQSEIVQSLPQDNTVAPPVPALQGNTFMNAPAGVERSGSAVLPPLSKPAHIVRPKTDREQIEEQLAILLGASSPWLGGSSGVDYRSGQPGYDRLAIFSGQIEASGTIGHDLRTTAIARPVLLDAGQPVASTTFRQGTLPADAVPDVQTAAGIGGEFQLRTSSFGASIGYTPHGFLVENVTGGLYVHPPSSHFTLSFGRDPIVDTQLSYAGLRDLGSKSATYPGNVWGGVITNAGEVQLAFGDNRAGWYIQGGGQYITGRHVEDNQRFDGDAGAYWAVWHRSEYGNLTLGMNFFGMHYDHNLRYFTYGQGGYFSPAAYMLAGIPFTFNGHYGPRFHYRVVGSLGAQAFQEDSSPYFPLDPAIQAANNNPHYPEQTSVGGNYSFDAEGAYAIAEHWYVGGYLNFNNARDYASEKAGFYVRYLIRPQPMLEELGPTGIFPIQGLRPLRVP